MATYREVIEGLQILASVDGESLDDFNVQAEHDEIYAGPHVAFVSEDAKKKLEELGWLVSEVDRYCIFT
jgi:hypothetical protein